jgi:hypothetical protein
MLGLKWQLSFALVTVLFAACIYERGWEYRVENAARVIDSTGKTSHCFILNVEPGIRVEIYAHVVIMTLVIELKIQNSTDMALTIDKSRLTVSDTIATRFEKPEHACESKTGGGDWDYRATVIEGAPNTEVSLHCGFASPKYPTELTVILDGLKLGGRTIPALGLAC